MLYEVACLTAVLNSIFIKPTTFTYSNLDNVANVYVPLYIIKQSFLFIIKQELILMIALT